MSIDAMKQALEALEYIHTETTEDEDELIHAAITALRLAIEQADRIQRAEEAFAAASDGMKGEQAERQEPVVNIELSRRMAAVKVSNFYGSIIKDAEKEIERLHGLVLQHIAPPRQEKQEPVCDKDPRGCWNVRCQLGKVCKNTAPPQRQPLTDEEIGLLTTGDGWSHCDTHALALFARAIERAHGIGGGE